MQHGRLDTLYGCCGSPVPPGARIAHWTKAHSESSGPFQYAGLTGYDAAPSLRGFMYEAAGISEYPQ
jgi:hypothetical protein